MNTKLIYNLRGYAGTLRDGEWPEEGEPLACAYLLNEAAATIESRDKEIEALREALTSCHDYSHKGDMVELWSLRGLNYKGGRNELHTS